MKYFAALLATTAALNWANQAAMHAWLEDHNDEHVHEETEVTYDISQYGTTVEYEADPGIDLIIQLDNLPAGATLKYFEDSLEVLGYTTPETLDGKRTAFVVICTPGDDDHGHDHDHEDEDGEEVFQMILSDTVTCTSAAATDCATAETLKIDIHVHEEGSLMMILLLTTVVLGAGGAAYYFMVMAPTA